MRTSNIDLYAGIGGVLRPGGRFLRRDHHVRIEVFQQCVVLERLAVEVGVA